MINVRKEFKKWRAICASVGGVGGVRAWLWSRTCVGGLLAWVACLREKGACMCSVGGLGGVLTSFG